MPYTRARPGEFAGPGASGIRQNRRQDRNRIMSNNLLDPRRLLLKARTTKRWWMPLVIAIVISLIESTVIRVRATAA